MLCVYLLLLLSFHYAPYMVACLDHFLHTTDHFTTLPVSFAPPLFRLVQATPLHINSILTFLGQMSLLRWMIWYHPQLRLCITLPKQEQKEKSAFQYFYRKL